MALSKTVENVLRLVEETTGLPVHVETDSTLPPNILARVTMARGPVPFHTVSYQPNASDAPDYLIVYQCGLILRRYGVAVEQRFDFVGTGYGEEIVRDWVQSNPKSDGLPSENIAPLVNFLHAGLLNQLRSIPVGLRVDDWILKEFPDLNELQQKAVSRQLNDNAAVFRPDVQGTMPAQCLTLNGTMSAAFALFWSQMYKQPEILLPYRASGYSEKGEELFGLSDTISSVPSQDNRLIDEWAGILKMSTWYRWAKASN